MFLKISFFTVLSCFSMQAQAEGLDTNLPVGAAENSIDLAGESAAFLGDGLVTDSGPSVGVGRGVMLPSHFDQSAKPASRFVNPTSSSQDLSQGTGYFAGYQLNQTISGNNLNSGNSINSGNTVILK